MANKKTSLKTKSAEPEQPRWMRIGLSLTLVPLVAGVIFIAAWALDIALIGELESQLYVGFLLMLVGFIFSNLMQKRWALFAGWLLLAIADLIFLLFVNLNAQIVALAIMVAGFLLMGRDFYRQFRENSKGA
jgi:hypothetical protein